MREEKEIGVLNGTVKAYMCLVDWEYEAGFNASGNRVSYSVENLKENTVCCKGCGIVEVEIKYIKTIHSGTPESEGPKSCPKCKERRQCGVGSPCTDCSSIESEVKK